MALHFCLNPPRDYLGNLRLFSDVLMVTICDHGCIHPARTMGKALNRRRQQIERLLATDVALRSEESQDRTRDSGDRRIRSLRSEEVSVLARCGDDVQVCRSTDEGREERLRQPDQILAGTFVH